MLFKLEDKEEMHNILDVFNFDLIEPQTTELADHVHLKIPTLTYNGKILTPLFSQLSREADQRLCFRYIYSMIPLLSKSEILRL